MTIPSGEENLRLMGPITPPRGAPHSCQQELPIWNLTEAPEIRADSSDLPTALHSHWEKKGAFRWVLTLAPAKGQLLVSDRLLNDNQDRSQMRILRMGSAV